jgi:TonB family protein
MKMWALFIACLLISGARAQNDRASATALDKAAPVYIHGEPVYRVGGDVTAPRAVYQPDPEYSEEARLAQLQGTCVLWVVVGMDGKPHDVRIAHSLGLGLDEKSMEAIRTWRFEPAKKNGQAVSVQINVETSFRLSSSELPVALEPTAQNRTGSLGNPDKHTADYPLQLHLRFVKGRRIANGYVITADGNIAGGAQPRKVTLTCRSKE